MKRRLAFSSLAAMLVTCGHPQAAPLNLSGYRLTLDENFATLQISAHGNGAATKWTAHTPWNGDFGDAMFDNPGPTSPFTRTPAGLSITAHKDEAGHWHSGLLCSVDQDGPNQHGFTQQYGYFEMKAKLPNGPGVWPAFWLIGKNKTTSSSEIDVIEYYGQFNKYYHSTTHIWRANGTHKFLQTYLKKVPAGLLTQQFNTYGVLIEPDRTSFYLNRQIYWSIPTPPEYRQPFYILVNLALGGGWPTTNLPSPQIMQVQYIHVYQRK